MPSLHLPLRTDRLTLRPFEARDLDAFHAYASLPEVVRYMYWEPLDRPAALAKLTTYQGRTALRDEGDVLTLAMELAETSAPQVIGEVMLVWRSRVHRQGELGFACHPAFQGRGFVTEAAAAMLDVAFDHLDLHRVCGRCDPRNTASGRLMSRLGMHLEAHLVESEFVKGEWVDEQVYAVLRREWRAGPDAGDPEAAEGEPERRVRGAERAPGRAATRARATPGLANAP
jgi:RimJ/RimL family protein N-acetyltransferase